MHAISGGRGPARRARAAIAALLFAAAGCQSAGPERSEAERVEVAAPSDSILRQVTLLALDKSGFPPGTEAARADLQVTSGWDTSLAPFKGEGFRERAVVRYERVEGGRYGVEVRVARERNDELERPLDPALAKWKSEADNEERARIVLQHIRAMLGQELEVGPRPSEKIRRP
jgi:hypothetical protein